MKISISTFFFLLIYASVVAQAPANDDCSGLIDLGVIPYCSDPGQYTNVGATASDIDPTNNIPSCFNNAAERDVWFQFTLPPDGSIVDIAIDVFGDVNGNGTMHMPQVAIYRGDCVYGGLAELACAAAAINDNQVHLEQFGLTPGIQYYLRINDYAATAGSNAGTFKLCISKYVPEFNMGDVTSTQSCTGTVWDSGGPTNDYGLGEDFTLTICPQDFHQCILINVESYDVEQGYDYLSFYQGADISALQLTQISGNGSNFQVQIPTACATIRFTSDNFVVGAGFKITWQCSTDACTSPPPTTCSDPAVIPTLPYIGDNLNNCLSGNTIADGPCDDDAFMAGNDYIFSYTSPGDECIHIVTTGTNTGAGVGVYDMCPSLAGANCIASAGGGFASVNPLINAAFLENPGTYYIVFGAGEDCSPFNITVDTITCPVVLPPASTCDNALNIGGCSNVLPEVIALTPGSGDPGFLVDGVNQGCFVNPQQNYSFFYFVAGSNGKFGFSVEAADPNEASDIDFNVWGPIDSFDEICDYVSNNQPVRSSWSGGADPTGLADIHPVTNTPVTDEFDCDSPSTPSAAGDDFVSRLDVVQGKIYVVLLDDYGNAIINSGISIDFSGTTAGVLEVPEDAITVSQDTSICPGEPVQLLATGGSAYFWTPDVDISCTHCPDPIVNPTVNTSYQVQIATACNTIDKVVDVRIINLNLGPDPVVCNGAEFVLNPNPYPFATYNWTGSTGLSCLDCPSPVFQGQPTGIYTYIATLTTPQCVKTDTIKVTVLNGVQPQYQIATDTIICAGETVNIGGNTLPGIFYDWSSVPSSFSDATANPAVSPTGTTTYYLSASNGSCPVSAVDSITVTVFQAPVISLQPDTAICNGQTVLLGNTIVEPGITYAWAPANNSLDSLSDPNTLATPLQTTTYTLTATNPGCEVTDNITVAVVNLDLSLSVPDTVELCQGTPLTVDANISPASTHVNWTPISSLVIANNGQLVIATPFETTMYTATASLPGCLRVSTVYVKVDSLPEELDILPADTTVCQGTKVLLKSVIYEPAEYPNIEFLWTPSIGQLTPDSLFNMVVVPDDTVIYHRITRNGACVDTATTVVNVIVPPQMTVDPPQSAICVGESVTLHLTIPPGVEDVKWSPATGLSCDDCSDPVASPQGTTSYSISGDYKGCPVGTSTVVQVKNPPPILFPSDISLCFGESTTLNQANDPTATYTWTSTDPTFGTVVAAQPTITPAQTATYFVNATNGCAVQDQVTITVYASTLSVSADTTVCNGNPVTIAAITGLPGSFQWNNGTTTQVQTVSPASTTTYSVVYTYGDNCQLTDAVTVNVQGDAAAVTFPGDPDLCPGESLPLNSTVVPGASYQWTSSDGSLTSNEALPVVMPDQTTTYYVTTTLGSCIKKDSITVVVYKATLTMPTDISVCAGENVTLTASASSTGTYAWSNGQTGSTLNLNPVSQTGTYNLVFTYGGTNPDCILTGSVTVTAKPNFGLNIVADNDTFDLGEPIDLMAVVSPSQNLNSFQWVWSENNSPLTGGGESITVTPQVTTLDTTIILYSLTATNAAGCSQTDDISIVLIPPTVRFPNAFTPNGDQVNSTFKMVVKSGIATVDKMEIYNRWGTRVFYSTDPQAEWDGKVDGKEAPSDVYVYIVYWRDGSGALRQPAQGEVTLLR